MKEKTAQKTISITKAAKLAATLTIDRGGKQVIIASEELKPGMMVLINDSFVKVVTSRAKKTAAAADSPAKAAKASPAEKSPAELKTEAEAATKAAEAKAEASKTEAAALTLNNPAKVVYKTETEAEAAAVKAAEAKASETCVNGNVETKAEAEAAAVIKNANAAAEAKIAKLTAAPLTINGNNFIKRGKVGEVRDFVSYDIAAEVARRASAACKDYILQLGTNHPAADFRTCSDEELLSYAKEFGKNSGKGRKFTDFEAAAVIEKRRALLEAEAELASQKKTAADWQNLSPAARNSVKLYSIRNYPGTTLDKAILETGKKDDKGKPIYIDFVGPIKAAVRFCGNKNEIANTARALIHNVFKPNELTYGISCTLEQILKSADGFNLSSFLGAFLGTARIDKNGKFVYLCDVSAAAFVKAFLVFVSVLVEAGDFKAVKGKPGKK